MTQLRSGERQELIELVDEVAAMSEAERRADAWNTVLALNDLFLDFYRLTDEEGLAVLRGGDADQASSIIRPRQPPPKRPVIPQQGESENCRKGSCFQPAKHIRDSQNERS